eukprot:1194323-Prorocentrum_minimum.AAC.8
MLGETRSTPAYDSKRRMTHHDAQGRRGAHACWCTHAERRRDSHGISLAWHLCTTRLMATASSSPPTTSATMGLSNIICLICAHLADGERLLLPADNERDDGALKGPA